MPTNCGDYVIIILQIVDNWEKFTQLSQSTREKFENSITYSY